MAIQALAYQLLARFNVITLFLQVKMDTASLTGQACRISSRHFCFGGISTSLHDGDIGCGPIACPHPAKLGCRPRMSAVPGGFRGSWKRCSSGQSLTCWIGRAVQLQFTGCVRVSGSGLLAYTQMTNAWFCLPTYCKLHEFNAEVVSELVRIGAKVNFRPCSVL